MLYDFENDIDVKRCDAKYEKAKTDKSKVEFTIKAKKRTIRQNSYLHSLLQLYAIQYGDTLHFCKQDLKLRCPFMHFKKDEFTYVLSSAGLDTKGMSDWIEWIKNYAGKGGIFLPNADEYGRDWDKYESEIQRFKPFL